MSFNELAISFKKIVDELFSSQGFECRRLVYGKNIYYCGRDILKCLNYSEEKSVIRRTLNKLREQDKFTIEFLERNYIQGRHAQYPSEVNINKDLLDSLDQYERNYIFINKTALYYLIGNSKKEEAKPFQDFIYYILLPALDNKYEELMNQKDDKIDELINLSKEQNNQIKELLSGVETIKNKNDQLLEKVDTLLQDNTILKEDNEIINNELNTIREDQDELKTTIENILIPNRNLPPQDINFVHGFAIYKINDNSYYCLRGQNKYIRNKLKDVNPEDIIIYNENNPNPIDFYKRFKDESKRLSDSLLEMILRTLSRKDPNFDPSSIKGKKLIDRNMNKLKYFTVSANIITLNRSKLEDIIQFYNSLIEEKTKYN